MKLSLITLGYLLCVGTLSFAQSKTDKELIEETISYYLAGGKEMEKAFAEKGELKYVRDGAYNELSSKDFVARVASSNRPKPVRTESIEFIDIQGSAAIAKVKLDSETSLTYDYMSLLKIDGQWKIVTKIFHSDRK